MLTLIQLIVVITMITIFITNLVDNIVQKWFGKDKVAQRKEYFTKRKQQLIRKQPSLKKESISLLHTAGT